MRERYVMRNGELVPKHLAPPKNTPRSAHSMSDIAPFVTTDGVEISSRSALRAYESKMGVKQVGTDWTGSKPPAFWDLHLARQKGSREEPR